MSLNIFALTALAAAAFAAVPSAAAPAPATAVSYLFSLYNRFLDRN
jgi:hypothetical protein